MMSGAAQAEKPEAIAIKRPGQSQAVFDADGRTCQAGLRNMADRTQAVTIYARCMMAHGYNVKLKGIPASAVQQGGPAYGVGYPPGPAQGTADAGVPAKAPTPEQMAAVGQHNADALERWHAAAQANANAPARQPQGSKPADPYEALRNSPAEKDLEARVAAKYSGHPLPDPPPPPAVLRKQGEKAFNDAFSQLNTQPFMFFGPVKTDEQRRQDWIKGLQEAANDGYAPGAVWYVYNMPANSNPEERVKFAKLALDQGGPDGEFIYGLVEMEHPETKQDGMEYMEKGLKDGSLMEALALTKLAEQKKDYPQCLTLALAVRQAKISMADPEAYRCGKHLSDAERKSAVDAAKKVQIQPWAGFAMESIQADQSGARELEDLIFADALKVKSAAPTKEDFHTMYVYQQRLQQRSNSAMVAMAAPMTDLAKTLLPGMGPLITTIFDEPGRAAEVQANAILTTISIKEYEGVWIGRFTLRERGDDVEHALRLKAKPVDGRWMLVAVDRGGSLDEWTDAVLPPAITPPNYDGPYISESDVVMRTMFGREFLK